MFHQNSPEFLEPCDIFWLQKYFDINRYRKFSKYNSWNPSFFKTCNFKVHWLKNSNFMLTLICFWKLSTLMFSRYFGEHFRTNCVQTIFIEAFKYQKYTKFIWNCPEMTFLTFAVLVAKFWNKYDCKLDKNLRSFSTIATLLWVLWFL